MQIGTENLIEDAMAIWTQRDSVLFAVMAYAADPLLLVDDVHSIRHRVSAPTHYARVAFFRLRVIDDAFLYAVIKCHTKT